MNYGISVPPAGAVHLPPATIPPKIQAALAWTGFCEHVQNARAQTGVSGDLEKIGRKLLPGEQRCYDAAVSCMTEYFNSEGFGDDRLPPGGGNAPVTPPVLTPVLK